MPSVTESIRERLSGCLAFDRSRLSRRLREVEHLLRHGRHEAAARGKLEALTREIEKAGAEAASRAARLPKPSFPPDLPIVQRKEEIASLIRDHQVVVVCGETGSGKSTQLPKICLELGRGATGFIGHTQPRRIAARAVAERLSEELGSAPGDLVGYKVRFTDHTRPSCFVKVMTDGVLLAETQGDRLLERYDTLIIDEAHERSLNIDFLLGYVRTILPQRPDLKVIITSATIDPQRFAEHFGLAGRVPDGAAPGDAPPASIPAPVIEVSGRTYPVEVRYRPLRSGEADADDRTLSAAVIEAVDELGREATGDDPGDTLVFLPGEREIREVAEELEKHHAHREGSGGSRRGLEVLPLYARLSAEEQHRVFRRRAGVRRVVLATNVAETSLTVPGVRSVIDTGLARISRYSTRSRVQALPIEKVSRASAAQRAGRCGRVGPGVCVRLYGEDDFLEREEFTPPEILRTNLASVILQMKALRLGEIEKFPFVEAPNPRAIQEGYETLTELGAIDDRGRLTPVGSAMARLPIDPRLARMILAAEREKCVPEVLVIAAALSVQDPRERPLEQRDAADRAHARWVNAHIPKEPEPEGPPIPGVARRREDADEKSGSDFMAIVNLWAELQRKKGELSSSKFRRWCKENFLGYVRVREWMDVHAQLHRLVTELGVSHEARGHPGGGIADEGHVHRALLTGLLVNIGRFDDSTREYAGTHGAKFSVFPGSAMFSAKAKWVMAAERVRTTRVYARTVARIRPEWIEELAPGLIKRSYADTTWNERTGTAHVFETVFLFGLEVIPRRRANLAQVDPPAARAAFIHHALLDGKYHHQGAFFAHNQRVLSEAHRLEAKARRRDLTADLTRRFEFYDRRLPEKVTSGGAFERWRVHAEQGQPDLLKMGLRDLLRPGAALPDPEDTPDSMTLSGGRFPLSYRFDPGDHDDGVTVTVPLAALNAINAGALEWTVPGWAGAKAVELLRMLTKDVRKALGPAPETAAAFIASGADRGRSMLEQLAAFVSSRAGVVVPASQFHGADLPLHMMMRVLVTDARGRPIASGRDLAALRQQLKSQIAGSLASLRGTEFNRTGMTDWEFGDVPSRVEVDAGGARVPAYPALTDEGRTVGMRLCDGEAAAEAVHQCGLRRLLALRVKGEIRAALDHAPGIDALVKVWGPLGTTAELFDTLTLMVAQRVFLSGRPDIRTFGGFRARVEEGFGSIVSVSLEVVALAGAIVGSLHRVNLRLDVMKTAKGTEAWAPALEGVTNQLSHLCPRGFLLSTPADRLGQLPRYLRAMESRLEKIQQGKIAQDQQRAAELRPHLRRWLDTLDRPGVRLNDAALEAYRWMLEEYRVHLFAQELRPQGPALASPRKLDEAWEKVVAGGR